MDRRSLLFIVAISFSFFFVNFYFTKSEAERQVEFQKEQEARFLKMKQEQIADLADRTKSAEDLPLVELYSDDVASHFVGIGVNEGSTILTLLSEKSLPGELYFRPLRSTKLLKRVQLLAFHHEEGQRSVFLYGSQKNVKLETNVVPFLGTYDVQLIKPIEDLDEPVKVSLGVLEEGKFTTLTQEQVSQSIALIWQKTGFIPIGVVREGKLFPLTDFAPLVPYLSIEEDSQEQNQESFYLLANDTLQLVFSEVGGAVVEVNLPFELEGGGDTIVRPIDPDRRMLEVDPKNGQFPLHRCFNSKKEEVQSRMGGFYPLLRRDLIGKNGETLLESPPEIYALNIVSQYPELAELKYKLVSHTDREIVFEGIQDRRRIRKGYRLTDLPYVIELDIQIEGDARGLWLTTGVPEVEWIAGSPAPDLKYRILKNGQGAVESISPPSETINLSSVEPSWVCNSNGFFAIILGPVQGKMGGFRATRLPGAVAPSRLLSLGQVFPKWKLQDLPGYSMMVPLKASSALSTHRIFLGPLSTQLLHKLDASLIDEKTGTGPDYILCQSSHGWFTFISEPFSRFLFWIMDISHSITGSWALSIVILTIVLRILMYPLTAWSMRSTKAMKEVSPKIAEIQAKYKKDPKQMQLKIMEVYKEHRINPLSGCIPLFIQMPFLIGMFDLLKSTFSLRGASFIPGWIDDLSAPDALFSWDFSIPFLGSEFHLLPILLGLVMWLQTRMGSLGQDPSKLTDQERQQRAMSTVMAGVFTLMFYSFPSGLNIYWLSSMLLGLLQQGWTSRKMGRGVNRSVTG